MGHTYYGLCPNCGKEFPLFHKKYRMERKYCSNECRREFEQKRMAANEAMRKAARASAHLLGATKTPPEQCKKCQYGGYVGGMWGCNYFEITKHTRHSLHPEGLPDECQEFEKKKRGRPKGIQVKN